MLIMINGHLTLVCLLKELKLLCWPLGIWMSVSMVNMRGCSFQLILMIPILVGRKNTVFLVITQNACFFVFLADDYCGYRCSK